MRRMSAVDHHITELEQQVLDLVKASPLSHHTHPSLRSLHKIDTNTNSTTTISTTKALSSSSTPSTTTTKTITTTTTTYCEYSNDQTVPALPSDCVSPEQTRIFDIVLRISFFRFQNKNRIIFSLVDMQRKYFLSPTASVKGSICIDGGAMMAVRYGPNHSTPTLLPSRPLYSSIYFFYYLFYLILFIIINFYIAKEAGRCWRQASWQSRVSLNHRTWSQLLMTWELKYPFSSLPTPLPLSPLPSPSPMIFDGCADSSWDHDVRGGGDHASEGAALHQDQRGPRLHKG